MGGPRPIWWRPGEKPAQPRDELDVMQRVFVCPNGCWWWLGGTSRPDGRGYGRILRIGTRCMVAAHRFIYELLVAPVPIGMQLDHICNNTLCVSPHHLEPVTGEENLRRKWARNQVTEWFEEYQAGRDDARRLGSMEDDLAAAFD